MVIHENVEEFDWHVLHALLGCVCWVYSTIMEAADLGWPVWRRRRWTILLHRGKALASSFVVSHSLLCLLFFSPTMFSFLNNLIASVPRSLSLVLIPTTFLEEVWDLLVRHVCG